LSRETSIVGARAAIALLLRRENTAPTPGDLERSKFRSADRSQKMRCLKTVVLAMALAFDRVGEPELRNGVLDLYDRDLQYRAPETDRGWYNITRWCQRCVDPSAPYAPIVSDIVEARIDADAFVEGTDPADRNRVGACFAK